MPSQTAPSPIDMAIYTVFECKNGKIARAHEYYEVEQMRGPGAVKPVYADEN